MLLDLDDAIRSALAQLAETNPPGGIATVMALSALVHGVDYWRAARIGVDAVVQQVYDLWLHRLGLTLETTPT